jgi:hypothetical protein
METTLPERRTGARWVAASGACLLAAAAALFVAVRWDELPDGARFTIVAAFTAACLGVGLRLRPSLPATGDALFHLGAVLLPIDLAALELRIHLGWRGLLLAEGVLVTVGLGGFGIATGSVVLRRAGVVGGIVLAAGVAAVGPAPAALVLAALAVAALAHGSTGPAIAWAATAGLAPMLSAVAAATTIGDGTFVELGFAGDGRLASAASGVVAAVVLGRLAAARHDVALASLAAAALAVGVADGWFRTEPGAGANATAAAGVFLLTQLGGLVLRRDPFWGRPAGWVALVAEVLAGVATLPLVLLLAAAPLLGIGSGDAGSPSEALAAGVLAAGWAVAALQRRPALGAWQLAAAAVSGAVGVEVLAGRPVPTGIAMAVAAAVLLAIAGRVRVAPMGTVVATAAALGVWGTVTTVDSDVVAVMGTAVALGLTVGGARLHRRALAVSAPLALGIGLWAEPALPQPAAVALTVAGTWALALLADALGSARATAALRCTIPLPVVLLPSVEPQEAVAALLLATVALAVESVRARDDRYAYVAAALSQLTVVTVAHAAGLTDGRPGIALCLGAVVAAGIAALVDDARWRRPILAAAAMGTGAGIAVAALDPSSLATAAMIAGGLVLSAGVATRQRDVAHLGAAVVTAGLLGHLRLAGIGASEAYLAPIAVQLLVLGADLRRRWAVSSWEAYAPAVVLLGGAAFVERLAGGHGWHAVAAGAVALAAIGAGATARLIGPLLTGTALLVAVTAHESLAVAAGVPTWCWLAAGGTALLATGVLLERNDRSPVEAGRRVVDVVAERFE